MTRCPTTRPGPVAWGLPVGDFVAARGAAARAIGRAGADRGSATVLAVGAVTAVLAVLVGVLLVAATVRDVHRARAAADLAALAAAGPAVVGAGADCQAGASVAAANGAALTSCAVAGDGSVVVAVSVRRVWPPGWSGMPTTVSARARAGVVDEGPPP